MTLQEWADAKGYTDRQIADQMTERIRSRNAEAAAVSVPAVQKYRTGRVPSDADRMMAIWEISEGWVTANDFFGLPVAEL